MNWPAPLPPALGADEVGLFLAEAVQVMGGLEAAAVQERADGEPLPRGMLNCGEACRMVPAVILLALQLYPQLAEDGVLEALIRNAMTTGSTGAVQ